MSKKIQCIECGGEMKAERDNKMIIFECQECGRKLEIDRGLFEKGVNHLGNCAIEMGKAIKSLYKAVAK